MSNRLWTCHKRGRDCARSATGYGLGQILRFTKMHWIWTMSKFWVAQEDFLIFINASNWVTRGKARASSSSLIIRAFFFENYEYVPQCRLWSSCPVRSPVLTTVILRTYETYETNLCPCPEGLSLVSIPESRCLPNIGLVFRWHWGCVLLIFIVFLAGTYIPM